MTRRNVPKFGIAARLMMVAIVPPLLVAVGIMLGAYAVGKREGLALVSSRANVLAQALSSASQFDVAVGNAEAVRVLTKKFIGSDPAIESIVVLDGERRVIVSAGDPKPNGSFVEVPIRASVASDDVLYGPMDSGSVSKVQNPFSDGKIIGFVRVHLSSQVVTGILDKWMLWSFTAVGGTTLIGLLVSIGLAHRLIRWPLNSVINAVRGIRRGHLEVEFNDRFPAEIGELQDAIISMAQGIAKGQEELEAAVAHRTSLLSTTVQRLAIADSDRRKLLAQTHEVVEEERRRISGELHDQFNASILAVKMQAHMLLNVPSGPENEEKVRQIGQKIIVALERIYSDARVIIRRLRPEVLDTLGLSGAVLEAVRMFEETAPGVVVRQDIERRLPTISERVAIVAYRAVQEALNNVAKHAHATEVYVQVKVIDGCLVVRVFDDGVGISTSNPDSNSGFGLRAMRERIEAVDGSLEVGGNEGKGTVVSVKIPIERMP